MNPPDNGERVRSLLCGREALARPSGMAKQHVGGADLSRCGSGVPAVLQRHILSLCFSPKRSGGNDKTFPVRCFNLVNPRTSGDVTLRR